MRFLFFTTLICMLTVIVGWSYVHAQVRSSTNYQLQSDSINFGGGLSTSTNYEQESTFGELATGVGTSTSYNLYAGYQQMQAVFLSLTVSGNVTMTPSINGITGGESNGSTTLTAITDSPSGYQLTLEASASPALVKGGDSIADYTPAGGDPDRVFTTGATDAHFGYSPDGVDVVTRFETDGSTCNASGSASSTACWDGLSTTAETIAQNTSPNQPTGATTTVYFKVGIGTSVIQAPGDYVATSTVTLLPL